MDNIESLGGLSPHNNMDDIPEKVTVKELRLALEQYAQADKKRKDYCSMKYLSAKEDAGDRLYQLSKAILKNGGFYTFRDAVIDSMKVNSPSPAPEDFE